MQSFVDFVQFTVTAKPRPGQHLPTLSKRFGKDLEGLVLKVYTQIPNNVGLSDDRKVLKALEKWHPGYINWWNDLIPQNFQDSMV